MERLPVPAEALAVCKTLADAGFEAYLVGGCVRDLVIGRAPKDWDVTTNATPEQIQSIFPETFYENDFGTVGIVTESEDSALKVIEVTPYRIEGEYEDARRPTTVHFNATLSDDLKRRDFTVNAIAYNPYKHEVIDEHNGETDLKRKVIATVGSPSARFAEDALRMLRAVRLSAELDFTIDTDTAAGIAENADQLAKISRERVRDELTKILLSPRPLQALYIAQKLGLLNHIIPQLEEGIGIEQNQAHSYDVFEHNMRSLQHAADKEWPFIIRIAALLHDIGKPASRRWSDEKNDWTFHGHEVVGAKMAKAILRDLKFPSETIETVTNLVRWHMFFSDPDTVTLSAVRRIIRNVGQDHINELLNLRICDRIGTGRPKEQPFRLRKYMSMVDEALRDPISVAMLKIDGNKVAALDGGETGPRIGWVLHALLEEVLDEPARNASDYMERRARELLALPQDELKKLGMAGKERKAEEEGSAVQELRKKHHVS